MGTLEKELTERCRVTFKGEPELLTTIFKHDF